MGASKCDLYCKPSMAGSKKHVPSKMILSRVLLGKIFVAKNKCEHLSRPPLDNSRGKDAPGDGLFDSVMGECKSRGGVVDHREFCIFHQYQAVPVAVIDYQHRACCECNLCS